MIVDHEQEGEKEIVRKVIWEQFDVEHLINNSLDVKHLYHPTKHVMVKFQIDDSG